jgi:DNA polymerase-3 subunit epsilon
VASILRKLRVLILDCQTTGATPEKGHLLEIGWCVTSVSERDVGTPDIDHAIVTLPDGARIPPAVSRVTGITARDLREARSPASVWLDIEGAVAERCDPRELGGMPRAAPIPCIAHYARFEERFLRDLHARSDPASEFPLRFLCTHEIGRRLFPDLPRRGLRALCGFFGFTMPEERRAAAHVLATSRVWAALVDHLDARRGVRTLNDLEAFLREPAPSQRVRWSYPLARETRLGLPDRPGVYRLLGGDGEVLYVGKATSLRARVNSYYRKHRAEDRVLELLSQVHDIDAVPTDTSLEAALLEAETIRAIDPPYNRALRDRGQEIWFFSPDLASAAPKSSARHRLGPFPSPEPQECVRTLGRLLRGKPVSATAKQALARGTGVDSARVEAAAWEAAVRLLAERHRLRDRGSDISALLSIGTRLWRERRIRAETPSGDRDAGSSDAGDRGADDRGADDRGADDRGADDRGADDRGADDRGADDRGADDRGADDRGADSRDAEHDRAKDNGNGDPAVATARERARQEDAETIGPEAIADRLEELLMSAARQLRRARWMVLLSESVVRWKRPDEDDGGKLLAIEHGTPAPAATIRWRDDPVPRPPEAARCRDRLAFVDRAVYDRLRVLTTELRRLAVAGRDVEVIVAAGAVLRTRQLRRLFEMI